MILEVILAVVILTILVAAFIWQEIQYYKDGEDTWNFIKVIADWIYKIKGKV